ncbi:MAG: ABC transporter ATP-binding protein [Armatimonadetes bacterium]|jgi:ABC-2 type transport system ATP-binding protein|nr:ABC transporter ATP-binding protein [Armatimonadota bacterium]
MIETEHLRKEFGDVVAVEDLSLRIPPGEFFGFLGPNGSGKTTTIKLLTGLLRPTRGRALIGGHDIQQEHLAAKRLIGYVPDTPYLYEKLTAREFLRFVGDLYELPEAALKQRIPELLDLFGLTPVADRLIEDYSHGMRQKAVMAACLLHEPRVIIIDEPMVGLDPQSAHLVKTILREQCRQGVSVFMSTHTLSLAEDVCDRVGIILKGRLVALGTVTELKQQFGSEGDLEDLFLDLTGRIVQ